MESIVSNVWKINLACGKKKKWGEKKIYSTKKGQKDSAVGQKNKTSVLFKNGQHNPTHTAPPSAFSGNHRPAANAKVSPSPIQQHKNAIEPVLLRAENKITVSWVIWRQQHLFSNGP